MTHFFSPSLDRAELNPPWYSLGFSFLLCYLSIESCWHLYRIIFIIVHHIEESLKEEDEEEEDEDEEGEDEYLRGYQVWDLSLFHLYVHNNRNI